MAHDLAAFLGIAVFVIVTPGQDTVLTVRNTLLAVSEVVFMAVKLAGATYLVVLGLAAVRAAARRGSPELPQGGGRRPRLGAVAAFRQGALSDLRNPKMAVFFTSLLPQFAEGGGFTGLLALGLLFCALTLGWLSGYAVAVARAGDVLRRPRIQRAVDAVTGAVLVAFGIRLASAQR